MCSLLIKVKGLSITSTASLDEVSGVTSKCDNDDGLELQYNSAFNYDKDRGLGTGILLEA